MSSAGMRPLTAGANHTKASCRQGFQPLNANVTSTDLAAVVRALLMLHWAGNLSQSSPAKG
jgi:hypothetical protein